MSPTALAILIGIIGVALSAMGRPRVDGHRPLGVRATAASAVIGVVIVAALERSGLFASALADGSALAFTIAAVIVLQIATVLAVLTIRRRRAAPRT